MNDMSSVIVPKSDQINADDLIPGPRTITIREVQIRGGQEQPVSIYFDGSDKAFRPCKSMSRVLVAAWGPDAKVYVGRSLTLFRDPTVKWAGMEVGGIRISHMSHIDGKLTLALTATKGSRKPFVVMPLVAEVKNIGGDKPDPAQKWANQYIGAVEACATPESLNDFANARAGKLAELQAKRPDLHTSCVQALDARRAALAGEGRTDDQHGDQFATDDDVPDEF